MLRLSPTRTRAHIREREPWQMRTCEGGGDAQQTTQSNHSCKIPPSSTSSLSSPSHTSSPLQTSNSCTESVFSYFFFCLFYLFYFYHKHPESIFKNLSVSAATLTSSELTVRERKKMCQDSQNASFITHTDSQNWDFSLILTSDVWTLRWSGWSAAFSLLPHHTPTIWA